MAQLNDARSNNLNNNRRLSIGSKIEINSLLEAVADCVSALLGDRDFESGVNKALKILGTSIDADRLGVCEQHNDPKDRTLGYIVVTHEWLSSDASSQLHHPELNRIDCEEIGKDYHKLISGNHAGGLIEDYPEPFRRGQEKLGVKATYAIPIIIRGRYWGFIGIDFCRTARELCEAEIAVLKTAATCIGSAIQREHNRQEKEAAERKALLQQQKAEELQKRDRLLNITAQAAKALLNDINLERAIAKALRIVGEGIDTDRVCVMEHYEDTGSSLGFAKTLFEWNSPYAVSQLQHPELQQVSYEGMEDWYEQLRQGEAVGGDIEELPEAIRQGQLELGVKSMYAVPIIVEEEYCWGVVGFDDCREVKQRTESEISILKATAACIGSAIQQSRISRQREQAERQALVETEKAVQLAEHNLVLEQRDRILVATAEASDILLREEDLDLAVNKALKIIGQAADTDRAAIAEHFNDPSQQTLGHLRLLYEWHTSHTPAQLTHSELSQICWNDVEEAYWIVSQGKTHSGTVDEMDEPFRSGQKKINVKSTYTVPIMVQGKFWGFAAFDDCREETRRSEAELSILKTAAACIGGAIQRERIRRAKEEADRNILLEREQAAIEKAKQLRESNLVLSLRDRWLEATANAANKLLEIADLDEGINAALKVLGESLDCDRVAVMQNFEDSTEKSLGYIKLVQEWDSPGISRQISHSELVQIPSEGIEDWFFTLKAGGWIGGILKELKGPFRTAMAQLNVKSTYAVSIFVKNSYWGAIGVDFCREARRLTPAEIAVFKTAASCVGSAISRQQIQQAKEEADRNILLEREQAAIEKAKQLRESNLVLSLRDRWLEATANAANKLLEISDLDEGINAALKVLGESLDCDRVAVMQYFEDNTGETSGFMRMLYGWNSTATVSQIDHPQLNEVSNIGMQENFDKVQRGEWIGGLIEEFPEPFRSEQIELGVKSIYSVPIFVNNQFWGILGIDFCREARRLTLPEIAVFKTAASCVGSAIARQQIQQEKEQAELAILEERNRIAREIHDTLAQAFTGISLQLEAAKGNLTTESDAVRERLIQAKNLAKEGITEARRSVRALRPEVLGLGLISALQQLIDKMYSGTDIKTEVVVEGKPYNLNSAIEAELFRIAQEAITNSLKHAQASEVCIQLVYEADAIHLKIEDDGIGFDPKSLSNQGFGLLGMQERCDRLDGNLVINSAVVKGTEITVTVEIG